MQQLSPAKVVSRLAGEVVGVNVAQLLQSTRQSNTDRRSAYTGIVNVIKPAFTMCFQ
jgi:hypothetical protein